MIEKLKKYLSKEDLPEEEVAALSKVLLEAREDYALKEQWKNTLAQKKAKKKNRLGILLLVIFLGAIAILYFVFNTKKEIPPKQYAINYIQESPYPINQTRGNSATDITLIKAAEAYQNKDYKTAINYYEQLSNKALLKENEQFYLALSFLNDGSFQKSLPLFQILEKSKDSSFQFAIELKFFLAVNYTLLAQDEKSLRYLKQLKGINWQRNTIDELIEKLEEK